jgi:hypothetical protein
MFDNPDARGVRNRPHRAHYSPDSPAAMRAVRLIMARFSDA